MNLKNNYKNSYILATVIFLVTGGSFIGIKAYLDGGTEIGFYIFFGTLLLLVSILLLVIGYKTHISTPQRIEQQLAKYKNWTIRNVSYYFSGKLISFIGNIVFGIVILIQVVIMIISFIMNHYFDIYYIFIIIADLIVIVLINLFLWVFFGNKERYLQRIVKHMWDYFPINEDYFAIQIEESLQKGMIYRQNDLILTKDFLLTKNFAIPYEQIKDIGVHREISIFKSVWNNSILHMRCTLKNDSEIPIKVIPETILEKNWSYYAMYIRNYGNKKEN